MSAAMHARAARSRHPVRTLAFLRWAFVPPSARPYALSLLALGIGCAVLALAEPAAAADLEPVAEVEGIQEYLLENGLKVLLFPDPSVQTLTVNVTYRVGSRHEGRGEAGMAHLLEHMVFKGTPTFPDVWDALEDRGARFNGTTWVDRTNYYETLPASQDNLAFALQLEADRMVNSTIRAEDLATEMTVVRNEFESGENNPLGVLRQRMLSAAYLWHPYGRPTIGNRSDIERVPVDKLRSFYKTYYQPDNAMLVVSGQFDAAFALAEIQRTFGKIPRPERALENTYTLEPPQDGPRSVTLRRVGSVASAALQYHIPAGSHPDIGPLEVLGEIVAAEPNGRLYTELVKANRASRVYQAVYGWHDPGVFLVQAEAAEGEDPVALREKMVEVLRELPGTLDAKEVERAKNKLLKDYRLGLTDSRRIAIALSDAEALGDWRLLFLQRDALEKVTLADVERVARAYLLESNQTAGLFIPTDEPERAAIPATPDVAALVAGYEGSADTTQGEVFEATAENIDRSTRRTEQGGMKLALLPKATRGSVVHAQLRFEFGTESSLAPHATALELLGPLLGRGTEKLSYADLSAELDRLQTELRVSSRPGAVDVSLQTTREQLDEVLALVAQIVRTPSLPQAELDVLRNEQLANIERSRSDPQGVLFDALYRSFYPFPPESLHYRPPFEEQIARLRAVDRAELASLHATYLSADHMLGSFVGDFDPEAVTQQLEQLFGGWTREEPFERIVTPYRPIEPVDRTLDTPDKEMTVVARGTTFTLRDTDPDYPALRFANYVLGQSPSSRLLAELRQKRGLSYGAGSFVRVAPDAERAEIAAYAICAPQNAVEAQDVIREEFRRWLQEPIPADELAEARTGYAESFKTQLSDDRRLVATLLENLRFDRLIRFQQEIIDAPLELDGSQIQAALQRQLGDAPFVDLKAGDADKFAPAAGDAGPEGESSDPERATEKSS